MNKKCVMIIYAESPIGLIANTSAVLALTLGDKIEGIIGSSVVDGEGHSQKELQIHLIPIQRNFDLAFLTKTALRQKPDYMIYGEVRDKAAYDMLNGANTGHKVWSTLHARSAEKAVQRLVNMVLEHMSKMGTYAIGKMIVQAVDIIYFQKNILTM
ncbi:ATPase, T2SS/T4P/T4SS family [Brevibacillus laterosporus]|uniref:ATPase, T2SS/T4P/T4SS family n=1 Tax=Brevibacillus laterosporus TaxID=1465 RepID=UPI001C3F113C|nr:ATPase, T2SS/T4P/T4SS family [Brevibacillus laterosporus]